MKKLTLSLGKSAERLRKERNDLRDTRTELIVARDKAQSAEKLKDEFIDNISHEIKVPLSAVSEYTRLIVDCIPDNKTITCRDSPTLWSSTQALCSDL